MEDIVGKKVWNTFWWTISTAVQDQLKEAVEKAAQGKTIKYEVAVWDKHKNPTSILFNLKPLLNPHTNHVEAIIAEGRPIQEIVDARTALLNKNEELKTFATVAAHDLREPIRAISSFMKLLKGKYGNSTDAKGMQFINHSIDAAERMNNLIVDLLERARIGTDEVRFEKINTGKLIQEILALQESVILEKNAEIIYSELPDITGQKTTIRLLFQNMISNALKYSNKSDAPLIEISAKRSGNFEEFKIKDNGIGIDPQNHEKVFMMFRRLHARYEYAGTGRGLATCKKIVKHHGGEIWIEGELGKGTTFYFTLPKE
jgi:light-regulated signal transduction histidine kinase (bacteriophytochrome)